MSSIKDNVRALADSIGKGLTVAKDGTVTIAENVYVQSLPEGLTPDLAKQLQEHNMAFAAGGLLALGEKAIPVMKKHGDIERVALSVPTVGKDSFEYSFARRTETSIGGGEPHVTYGHGAVKFSMYGTGARGEVKKVKAELSEKALEAFGS